MKAPESCSVASNGQWGGIIARPLTGVDAQQPVRQGACHPTTGKDYDLTLSAASRLNATSRNNKDIRPVLLGITPIMTTVYGGRLRDVEVDLTCLKTVGEKQNTATVKSGGVNIRVDAMKSAVWFGTLATITGLFFGFI